MEYFIAVAEEKSFSKAARKLFITQPSLSQVISKLESSYNTKFFDRSTNPLQITQEGSIFLNHAREMLKHEKLIHDELYELLQLKRGMLKIGVIPFRASCLLTPSITEFSRRHKNVTIKITEESTEKLEEMILSGDIDLAVTKGQTDKNLFVCEKIMSDNIYIAVSENNPINREITRFRLFADDIKNNSQRKKFCRPVDVGIFKNEKFLIIENDNSEYLVQNKLSERIGFEPDVAIIARHLETLFSFVLSGVGIAFIPEMFIKFANISYHPAYYCTDNIKNDICIISKAGRNLPEIAKEYIRIFKQFM
jgi:DNA-binding transcriptional LysR family regulator